MMSACLDVKMLPALVWTASDSVTG
jgi:hypothetical protein